MSITHHHAYIYEGALGRLPALERSARERFGYASANDPDVRTLEYEKFGIEEARELVRAASLKSVSGRALYIVGASSITSEAQQGLLKLFEEPQEGTVFVLLLPYGAAIPTLRSRLLPYPAELAEDGARKSSPAAGFLKASPAERSAEIAKLLKDEEGVRERVRNFLDAIEAELYARARSKKPRSGEMMQALEDIARARGYAGDRSPSMKMLLEHLAVSIPPVK